MADKQYRAIITIATDATVIDKTARANMGTVDDLVEKLLADHADSAITITVTEAADIVTVRAASAEPRKPRGSAVKDELAALKAQIAGLTEASAKSGETALAEHLPDLGIVKRAKG